MAPCIGTVAGPIVRCCFSEGPRDGVPFRFVIAQALDALFATLSIEPGFWDQSPAGVDPICRLVVGHELRIEPVFKHGLNARASVGAYLAHLCVMRHPIEPAL